MDSLTNFFAIMSFLIINPLFAQDEKLFDTTKEYLAYVEKKFKVEPSDIYYISSESDSLNGKFEKFGIVLLITENRIATINEIADEMGIMCSPQSLMPQISESVIKEASDHSDVIKNVILKNMNDGQSFKIMNEKIALYTFSIKFGKNANLFLKEKESLEILGYRSMVLSIDGAYIKEIMDIDKTPVYVD